MKVWINYREGYYSGGILLVAANTAEEAHKAFHDDPKLKWAWDIDDWTNPPCVEDSYYQPDGWKELPNVVANVNKPQVLAEGGYSE